MSTVEETRRLLASVPLFGGLTKKQLTEIAKILKPASFAAGSTIVTQGEPGGRFFLITGGKAKVVVNGRTRRRLGVSDFFGEIALLDERPRSATVIAETDVIALTLASFNFRALMKADASLAYQVAMALTRMVRDSGA